jgi:hypothetical protein
MLAELIDAAIIIFVLKRFVLTFAVVTPPAGENPPDKFNEVNVAVPAFTLFVEILPVLQIFTEVRMLPKSSFPTYKFPIKALPAPIVVVLIVPALNVLVEILPVFEILPVLVVPSVVVPATPRVPVLEVFVKEPVAAKSVFVEILPVLLIFTEVNTLPKSSLPTYKLPIKALPAPIVVVLIVPALNVFVEILTEFEILVVFTAPT